MRAGIQNALLGAAVLLTAATVVVVVARRLHSDPARCPEGTVALGARCCADGQQLQGPRCVGVPRRCPAAGCVARMRVVELGGGVVDLAPIDWQTQGVVSARRVQVAPFAMDSIEVTLDRWQQCARAGACRPLPVDEPGLPVRGVTPGEAQQYCRLLGGRLPTGDEWLWAAAGNEARRFPWGQTGLVCRRAVYGLLDGPCGRGGVGPDLAGLRPDGATPEGLLDLAGNVAEWTVEPGGRHAARGGSYASRIAAELRSWSAWPGEAASEQIGFRCAYDRGPELLPSGPQ
jgi:formylglycine-generating enzyme